VAPDTVMTVPILPRFIHDFKSKKTELENRN